MFKSKKDQIRKKFLFTFLTNDQNYYSYFFRDHFDRPSVCRATPWKGYHFFQILYYSPQFIRTKSLKLAIWNL